MLLVLILLSIGSAKELRDAPWGTTNCSIPTSCRGGQIDPRPCDIICPANGSCNLTVGVILPDDLKYIINMKAAIETIREAEAVVKAEGVMYEDTVVNLIEFDDQCNQAAATIHGLNASTDYCVHFIIGSTCDYCTATARKSLLKASEVVLFSFGPMPGNG
ncbi:hypothetical protein FQA39_LY09130 [Lamprigera yunnana]|nr:hypothetical protein FQA39_LY09130 [Lamprigera yunnana]